MADDQSQLERTEQATPKRLEDARKKGDVPRSRELTMTVVMLSGGTAILMLAGPMGGQLVEHFADALVIERSQIFDTSQMAVSLAETASGIFLGLAPLAAILMASVFLSAVAIGGWSFSAQAAAPKLERINPVKGIKRVFSANSLNELLKALAKFSIVGVIAMAWLWYSVDELSGLGRESVSGGIAHALRVCGLSFLVVSSGLVLIAGVDVPFQLWQYQKKLKMTRQQVKEEFKETEGRPEVKSRIRAMQLQVATQRMMEELPKADVVITNPTHFAVALRYDEASMGAPRVIAKGKDLIAKRIRDIAGEHKIPLFAAPPLARALYQTTSIGDEIPARLYTAVAQVLAYVYQINKKRVPGQRYPDRPIINLSDDEFS
ncbi:MAG TPA: flagellar biosynthesis protein FlhB [Woeseiaceae bacterium]|nr:flagellar biosynthesis protein FlhB [Woeseiaceae bacterium]